METSILRVLPTNNPQANDNQIVSKYIAYFTNDEEKQENVFGAKTPDNIKHILSGKNHIYTFDYKFYIKNEKGKISVYRDIKVNATICKVDENFNLNVKWTDNLGKKDIGNKSNIKIKKPEIIALLNSEKSN